MIYLGSLHGLVDCLLFSICSPNFYFNPPDLTSLKVHTRELLKYHGSVYIDKLKFRDAWYFMKYVGFHTKSMMAASKNSSQSLAFYEEEV